MIQWWFAIALGAAQSSSDASTTAEIAERVVAVVDRQSITLVDVKRAAAIEIAKQLGPRVFEQEWPPGFLGEIRTHLMQRTLLLEEARRYSQQDPSEAELNAALKGFRSRFPNEQSFVAFLAATRLSVDELKDDLRRSLRVDRFLEFRIRSRIDVQPEALAKYRDANPSAATLTDEQVRAALTDDLFLRKTLEYLSELVARAEVRLLGELPDIKIVRAAQ